ncbi:MAG: hypothetical protein HZY76_21400 [Anaerolineae bacterium]|nr:MAG: hypothetical protein HZY76_21400 [Anaerolineae bacterium]
MCYYAAQDLGQARTYLWQAVRFAPHLAVDSRFVRTFGMSLLGRPLITRLRRLRRTLPPAHPTDSSTWQPHV